jgi:hypothetical protein
MQNILLNGKATLKNNPILSFVLSLDAERYFCSYQTTAEHYG